METCLETSVQSSYMCSTGQVYNLQLRFKRHGASAEASLLSTTGPWAGDVAQSVGCVLEHTKPWVLSFMPHKPGVVVHTCNLSTSEVKTGGSGDQSHP